MFYERDTTDQILSLARVTTLGRLRAGLSYLLEAHGFRYYVFTCHTVEPGGACTAVSRRPSMHRLDMVCVHART